MNPHFGNAFAYRLAIAEIPQRRARKAGQDSRLCLLVRQTGQPRVEIGRPKQCIQVLLVYPIGYGPTSKD